MTIHYRCSCGRVFEYEEAKRRHYIGGETEIFCPSCGDDDFEEVFQCCDCGEFFQEDKLNGMYSDQLRCDDCLRKKGHAGERPGHWRGQPDPHQRLL